jgi:hypothetical protein
VLKAVRRIPSFAQAGTVAGDGAVDLAVWLDVSRDDLLAVRRLARERGLALEPRRPSR